MLPTPVGLNVNTVGVAVFVNRSYKSSGKIDRSQVEETELVSPLKHLVGIKKTVLQFAQIFPHNRRFKVFRNVVPPHVLADGDRDVEHGILYFHVPVADLEVQLVVQRRGAARTYQTTFPRYADAVVEDHEPTRQHNIVLVAVAINHQHVIAGESDWRNVQAVMNVGH